MANVSTHYRELTTEEEILRVASATETSWQHPAIPYRQYEIVQPELEIFRGTQSSEPFAAFKRCMQPLPANILDNRGVRLLDVGAAGGYYNEILKIIGFRGQYMAYDSSRSFAEFAAGLYPGIDYDVGDARTLPYRDDWFDVVLCSACIMHIYEWQKVIAELTRVSSRYLILHRTPIAPRMMYWEKEAYGIACLEIHFSEKDLYAEWVKNALNPIACTDSFWNSELQYGMRSYLLEKPKGLKHIQV